jgi:hypothetical protein
MKKLFLTSIATLFLTTGTHALDYRPQYDTRPWEAAQSPEPTYGSKIGPRRYHHTYIKKGLGCYLEEGFKYDGYGTDGYQCGIDPHKLTAIQRRCMLAAIAVSEPADDTRDDARNEKRMQTAYDRCLAKAKTKPAAHAAEIPKQYHGTWCQTKWRTVYKRCAVITKSDKLLMSL